MTNGGRSSLQGSAPRGLAAAGPLVGRTYRVTKNASRHHSVIRVTQAVLSRPPATASSPIRNIVDHFPYRRQLYAIEIERANDATDSRS